MLWFQFQCSILKIFLPALAHLRERQPNQWILYQQLQSSKGKYQSILCKSWICTSACRWHLHLPPFSKDLQNPWPSLHLTQEVASADALLDEGKENREIGSNYFCHRITRGSKYPGKDRPIKMQSWRQQNIARERSKGARAHACRVKAERPGIVNGSSSVEKGPIYFIRG